MHLLILLIGLPLFVNNLNIDIASCSPRYPAPSTLARRMWHLRHSNHSSAKVAIFTNKLLPSSGCVTIWHILSFPNFHHRCYRQPLPRPYPMDGCRGWWPLVSSSSPTSSFGLVLNPMLCSYFLFYGKHWHSKSLFRIVFFFLVFSTLKSWVFGIYESFSSRDSEENGSTSYVFEMTT